MSSRCPTFDRGDFPDMATPLVMAQRSQREKADAPEEDVRARVLEAAVQMMREGGLASLSMREVARRAGVSHQAPYHYFADREAILAAVAEQGFILLQRELDVTWDGNLSAADRLARAGETYVRFAVQHPAHFRVMFRPDFVDIERFPSTKACGEQAFERLIEVVKSCVAEGLPVEPSEHALVVFGWSVVHGLACLILDDCLTMKLPEEMATITRQGLKPGSKTIVSEVMETFRGMILARMGQGGQPSISAPVAKKKAAKAPAKRLTRATKPRKA